MAAQKATLTARLEAGPISAGRDFIAGIYLSDVPTEPSVGRLHLVVSWDGEQTELVEVRAASSKVKLHTQPSDAAVSISLTGAIRPERPGNHLASLRFHVREGRRRPFAIKVTTADLVDAQGVAVPLAIDSSPLSRLAPRAERRAYVSWQKEDVGPRATVATRALVEGPLSPGQEFIAQVRVAENPAGRIPISCNFRIYFPSEKLEYLGQRAGDLGGLYAGPPELNDFDTKLPDRYRDLVSAGEFRSTKLNPVCFEVLFRVRDDATGGCSIVVTGDPASSAPLIGPTSKDKVAHLYDNRAVTNLKIAPRVSETREDSATR